MLKYKYLFNQKYQNKRFIMIVNNSFHLFNILILLKNNEKMLFQ
jgi:hypothetical protein